MGVTRESLKPSPCSSSSRLFIRFPQAMPIVETLIFGYPEHQAVRFLIAGLLEHQQCNVNLQKGRSNGIGLTTSSLIKLAKI